ncbi:MAG: amidohydrolase family protein [Acidobacteriaceae bacterium]
MKLKLKSKLKLARRTTLSLAFAALAVTSLPAQEGTVSPAVSRYIKVPAGVVVLQHVRIIDGTGADPLEDQVITLRGGKIESIEAWARYKRQPPAGAVVLDLTGRTVMPGIVGMHDHMYYIARPNLDAAGRSEAPVMVPQMTFSSPHLYLGAGVTTLRTTGSVEPYTDLNLKQQIDAGKLPGPHMDVTAPYLEGANSPFIQMHQLKDADDAKATVDFWAAQGATSFKAYMNITRAELKAAIDEAHKLGFKITGHLCAITYPEAAEMGIDDLEHGFFVNTQLDPGKRPDICPPTTGAPTLNKMDADSPEAAALIKLLVEHHVALTSTLPVFESDDPRHLRLQTRTLETMSAPTREAYLYTRNLELNRPAARRDGISPAVLFAHGMALERKFVAAGGLLLAGPDPTGDGGVLPGFGDQREIELLVEAGFRPVEAIKIATLNGATYLGRAASIGSVAVGKNADLVVVKGDPAAHIADIENTEIVFKDGVGYDSQKLLDSVKGRYGQY